MSECKMTVEVCGQAVSGTVAQFEVAVKAIHYALASVHDGETWAVHVWALGKQFVELFFTARDSARFALTLGERDDGYAECVISPAGVRYEGWEEFVKLAGHDGG